MPPYHPPAYAVLLHVGGHTHIYCLGIRGREETLDADLLARVRQRLANERSSTFPLRLLRSPRRFAIDQVLVELDRGIGLVFEGFLDERARSELGRVRSLAGADLERRARFVVLPESGLVLEWAGTIPSRWMHVALRRVAGARVAMEAHVASIGRKRDDGALELKRRHLDADEKAELAGLVTVAHRRALRDTAGIGVFGLVVANGLRALLVKLGFTLDVALVSAVGLVPALVHYLRHRTTYQALQHDVEDGFVFVIRAADDAELGPSLGEVLPHSELPWTEDGQPARYRT